MATCAEICTISEIGYLQGTDWLNYQTCSASELDWAHRTGMNADVIHLFDWIVY